MDEEGANPSDLTPAKAVQLGKKILKPRKGTIQPENLARRFALHLLEIGVAHPATLSEAEKARADLLSAFEQYLESQRGLSSRTIYHVLRFANRFFDYRFGANKVDPSAIKSRDIIGFIEHALEGAPRDKTITSHLRNLLQFMFASGETSTNLSLSIPRVARNWGERPPRHLSPEGVNAVLSWVKAQPMHGARDHAMLILMARLGLRAVEIIAIELEDIDWRSGELKVRGKGQYHDHLPLGVEVGEAISRYLREEREATESRALFVTHKAPHGPFKDGQIANIILRTALKATDQKPPVPYVGSHLLRHSLAAQMANSGASLDEIGDVLRHRSRTSTLLYARLDIEGLRSIAQPWPAEGIKS